MLHFPLLLQQAGPGFAFVLLPAAPAVVG